MWKKTAARPPTYILRESNTRVQVACIFLVREETFPQRALLEGRAGIQTVEEALEEEMGGSTVFGEQVG